MTDSWVEAARDELALRRDELSPADRRRLARPVFGMCPHGCLVFTKDGNRGTLGLVGMTLLCLADDCPDWLSIAGLIDAAPYYASQGAHFP